MTCTTLGAGLVVEVRGFFVIIFSCVIFSPQNDGVVVATYWHHMEPRHWCGHGDEQIPWTNWHHSFATTWWRFTPPPFFFYKKRKSLRRTRIFVPLCLEQGAILDAWSMFVHMCSEFLGISSWSVVCGGGWWKQKG